MRVGERHLGRTGKCTKCGNAVEVTPESVRPRSPASAAGPRQVAREKALPLDWHEGDVVLGLYEVGPLLGEGGMGKVYRVRHRAWRMDLAVKIPRPEIFAKQGGARNFERECETWINLGLHPHVVSCYFVRLFGGVPLVFVECVEGGSLQQWIRSRRLYEGGREQALARILDVGIQMAWGLHHAHTHDLVHQDVKPANVLLTDDGQAKVTDFGVARARALAGETPGSGGQSILVSSGGMTPAYASPEQADHERLSRKTDIWSWALSVLEMFVGEVTWMAGPAALDTLDAHVANPTGGRPGIPIMPASVEQLLRDCFQPDPAARPSDMVAVADRLRRVYAEVVDTAYSRTPPDLSDQEQPWLRAGNLNNRAVSMIELGRIHEAVRLLQEASEAGAQVERNMLLQDIAYNYALAQLRWKSSVDVRELAQSIPASPDPRRRSYLVGMLYLEAAELYEAIDTLAEALEGDEAYRADALNARGIGLLLTGETQPAILSFKISLRFNPDRADVARNLALAYYYDGQPRRALGLFERLAERAVFDSEDTIRHATVLSACGRTSDADDLIRRALGAPERSTAVLLTAAELLCGAQTFLPYVLPTPRTDPEARKALVERAVTAEPTNLRALIDQDTLPVRYGFEGGAVIRQRKRGIPENASPARVGGAMAASYRAMTKRFRWGELPLYVRLGLALVSAVPPLMGFKLLVLARDYWFFRDAGPGWVTSMDGLPVPLHVRWPDCPWHFSSPLAGIEVFILMWPLCLLMRGAPSRSLGRDMLRLFFVPAICFAAASLLAYGLSGGMVGGLSRALAEATRGGIPVMAGLVRDVRLFDLILAFPIAVAGFFLSQALLQKLTLFYRAAQPLRSPVILRTQREARNPSSLRASRWFSARADRRPREPSARPREPVGQRLRAALKEWAFFLYPQAALPLVVGFIMAVWCYQPAPVLVWLPVAPAFLACAALAPRLMLIVNLPFAAWLGYVCGLMAFQVPYMVRTANLPGTWANVGLPAYVVALCTSACLVALNALAMRRCPEFVPEWRSCNPSPWDIRQTVDPLNIRRFAACWQLVRPGASGPTIAGRRSKGTVRGLYRGVGLCVVAVCLAGLLVVLGSRTGRPAASEQRKVRFPSSLSMGHVYTRDPAKSGKDVGWTMIGEARYTLRGPADWPLYLAVRPSGVPHLKHLSKLRDRAKIKLPT